MNIEQLGIPAPTQRADVASENPFTPDVARKQAEVANAPKQEPQPVEPPLTPHPVAEKIERVIMGAAAASTGGASVEAALRGAQPPAQVIHIGQYNPKAPLAVIETPQGPQELRIAEATVPPTKESKEQQMPQEIVPYASLTDGEKTALDTLFGTTNTDYAGNFKNVGLDANGDITGLPFEKGSQADTLVQSLKGIVGETLAHGGTGDLIIAVDRSTGVIAPMYRMTTDTPMPVSETETKVRKSGTGFTMSADGLHYLEPQDPETGVPGVISLTKVTDTLRTYVARFSTDGKTPVTIEPNEKYILDQVQPPESPFKGRLDAFVTRTSAIDLVKMKDASTIPATPIPGATAEPITTQTAPEVLAKVVPVEAVDLEHADIQLKAENNQPTSVVINGKEYPVVLFPKEATILTLTHEFKPIKWGLLETYQGAGYQEYAVTGIAVGSDQVQVDAKNPKDGKTIALTLDRIYMLIPVEGGNGTKFVKVRFSIFDTTGMKGGELFGFSIRQGPLSMQTIHRKDGGEQY